MNPLFIYVFAEIMGILLGATGASVFIYEKVLVPVLGNYPRFISLCFVVCIILLEYCSYFIQERYLCQDLKTETEKLVK